MMLTDRPTNRFVSATDNFVPPTVEDQVAALEAPPSDTRRGKICSNILDDTAQKTFALFWDDHFVSKVASGRSDWLSGPGKRDRCGETFSEYVNKGGAKISETAKTIGLVSIGELQNVIIVHTDESSEHRLLLGNVLRNAVETFFGVPTRWVPRVPLSNLQSRVHFKINVTQLRTMEIHDELVQIRRKYSNADLFCVMAVTMFDLYPRDDWNFVFGEASQRESTGVFSFARYTPQFTRGDYRSFQALLNKIVKLEPKTPVTTTTTSVPVESKTTEDDDEKKVHEEVTPSKGLFGRLAAKAKRMLTGEIVIELSHADKNQFVTRCLGVLLHELGHIFGLEHCVFFECVMNGSNHLEEHDAKPLHLCPICLKKLHYALRCGLDELDLNERYMNLMSFYESIGLIEVSEWYKRRAEAIASA